jgi:hypothetical protein
MKTISPELKKALTSRMGAHLSFIVGQHAMFTAELEAYKRDNPKASNDGAAIMTIAEKYWLSEQDFLRLFD